MSSLSRLCGMMPPLHSDFMAPIPVDPREELERLERKHAENPEGRYFVPLADAYRRSGDLSGAIDLLRAGLARHPDYLSAHVVLGRCYADSGDPTAAEAEFRYILSLDPQNLIALRTLGDIAHVHGRLREAERWYQDLLAVDPMNDDARSALGQLQTEEPPPVDGEQEGAGIVHAGNEPSPSDGSGLESPGAGTYGLDAGLGEMVELRSEDERGAAFDDDSDAVVTETIAELYTRQGFYDRAADVYRELLRRRGSDDALEAKLRRVEFLASGVSAGDRQPSPPIDSHRGVQELTDLDTPSLEGEPSRGIQWDAPSTPEDGLVSTRPADSLYPLIGPAGEFGAGELDDTTSDEDIESQVPPAYDFAIPVEDRTEPGAAAEDLEDLLIDPYADPFGSGTSTTPMDLSARSFGPGSDRPGGPDDVSGSGLLRPDPFADSFAEGFPALDAETPFVGHADTASASTSVDEKQTSASALLSGEMAIGAFLRSVATWSRSGPQDETGSPPATSETAATSSADGSEEPDIVDLQPRPAPSIPGPEPARSEEASPAAPPISDTEFDAASGEVPTETEPASIAASGSLPAEPSGADDLQLVTGTDDLFPWEIPVPDHGSQGLPPVQPLDLDPGYPFDEAPRAEAPFVDETVHSERSPSEAVEPSPSEAVDQISVPLPPDAEAAPMDFEAIPAGGGEAGGGPSSPPADARDDDDLESFQAWLRSLKR